MAETWKPIPEHPHYEVSDLGRVRSWKQSGPQNGTLLDAPRVLNSRTSVWGYEIIALSHNRKYFRTGVHRLVAAAFLGADKRQVNHKNGNKRDNRLSNLEYATASENMRHAYDSLGLIPARGTQLPQTKMNEWIVRIARRVCALGVENQHARAILAPYVSQSTYDGAVRGVTWKYLARPI